jgi:hypothetical protein
MLGVLAQRKKLLQKLVRRENILFIMPLRSSQDDFEDAPAGGFDSNLTPKTPQKTPLQGSENAVSKYGISGPNVARGPRHPPAVGHPIGRW